jgi:hypothetical protein
VKQQPPISKSGQFNPKGGDVLRGREGRPGGDVIRGREGRPGGDVIRGREGRPGGDMIHAREHHIPDAHFKTHFGSEHVFHVNRTVLVGSSHVILFGGVRFRCDYPIPVAWLETDPVYIDYVGGSYFLCNRLRPGVRVAVGIDQCDACAQAEAAAASAPCDSCDQQAQGDAQTPDNSGDTPTVVRGMTVAQTVAILGNPKDIVDLGIRRIYLYDNLKVSFFAGRVSDVR